MSGLLDLVPLPAHESAESDQSDEDDGQSDPEAPENDREDPRDHDDAADRKAGPLSIACRHVLHPPCLTPPEPGRGAEPNVAVAEVARRP